MTDFNKWINNNCIKQKDNLYFYKGRNYTKYELHDIFINNKKPLIFFIHCWLL